MEQNGIGTDASIPTHINNICQRNYVQVSSGRKLIPTNLGIVLIHGYQKIDPELSLPTMRSDVEQQLNLIASGKAAHGDVLLYFLNMFAKKFAYFTKQVGLSERKNNNQTNFFCLLYIRLKLWMNCLRQHSLHWLQQENPFPNVENAKGNN